jgi:hypothetical protein
MVSYFNRIIFVFVICNSLLISKMQGQNADYNSWILKLNAATLANFYAPSVTIGVEKQLSSQFSIAGEFGYQFYQTRNIADTAFIKPSGNDFTIELRYYFNNPNKMLSKRYIATHFFYLQQQYNSRVGYSKIGDTSRFAVGFADCFTVNKKKWGIDLVYGKQKQFAKHWIIDSYIGLGVQQKTIVNTHNEYDKNKYELIGLDLVPLFGIWDLEESSGLNAHITMGFRVGYIF